MKKWAAVLIACPPHRVSWCDERCEGDVVLLFLMMWQQILLQRRKNWAKKKAHCRYFAYFFVNRSTLPVSVRLCVYVLPVFCDCADSSIKRWHHCALIQVDYKELLQKRLPRLNLISVFPNNKLPTPALPLMSTRGADGESVFFPAEMKKFTAWYRKLFGLYDVCGVGVYTNSVF